MIISKEEYGGLMFDETAELKKNAMLSHNLGLFYEWNFEKNDEIGLDVYKVTKGVHTKAWWNCLKCKSVYDANISNKVRNSGCPYCNGKKVNHTNSLATLRPDIAAEWHPTKNGAQTPHDVTCGHGDIIWWLGKCEHWWEAQISSRTKENGSSCPYCSNAKLLKGFNDIWTTNPKLAELLLNPNDGYKYTQGSFTKVDWKCNQCENIIKNRQIAIINTRDLYCPSCSDNISFPEKFMYHLLKESGIKFHYDTSQTWSQGKRYDFYLPEYNWIIEVHGEQHYTQTNRKNARSLEVEQVNDKLKERLAKENGIDNYITIDARHSTIEWIKNSILSSGIMEMVSEIDFARIGGLSSNSLIKNACDLWNEGNHSTTEIGQIMKLRSWAIRKYLKRGTEIGWCNYCPIEAKRQSDKKSGGNKGRHTIQLSKEGLFIKEWTSALEVKRVLNIEAGGIASVCKGKAKTVGGFKWMYKEDYESYISNQSKIQKEIS